MPGVEISSGSLGHGLPLAVGTALGLRAQGIGARVVVLVGDAELDEGSNHEALELAAALGLDALTVVVVDNRSSSYAVPGRIAARFETEGWQVATVDGRDHDALEKALSERGVGVTATSSVATVPATRSGAHDRPLAPRPARPQFGRTVTDLLDEDLSAALVWAEISGRFFDRRRRRHPTGSSTSASASSCWSTSARGWR